MSSWNDEKLYDRDDHILRLLDAYDRCSHPSDKRVVVKIVGPQGAGKTALALQLKHRVTQDGGYFITGKFDQLSRNLPTKKEQYSPFVEAFSDLCHQIALTGSERASCLKTELEKELSTVELGVLQDAIAPLEKILGPQIIDSKLPGRVLTRGLDADSQCFHIVSMFVHAAASEWPLVVLLEDIQWANAESVKLFEYLATKSLTSRLLLICTHRDDKPDFCRLSQEKVVLVEIEVANLCKKAVNTFIADRLQVATRYTVPLADLIYYKTHGNVLFMTILVDVMLRTQLLTKDVSGRWLWDEGQIVQEFEAQSISRLVLSIIAKLPQNAIDLLKVASCLGWKFNENMLWSAASMRRAEVSSSLQLLVEMGLVVRSAASYQATFAYNVVQEVSYSVIPEPERAAFHLGVGQRLLHWLPSDQQENYLMHIVHQIGRGADLVDDPEEKVEYAELYLRAGQRAASSSEYTASSALLSVGIRLLGRHPWRYHYSVCLRLHNALTEIEYYSGNLDRVDVLVDKVLKRARNVSDAFVAHFTRVYSIFSRGNIEAALEEGLSVLAKFGEQLPRKPGIWHRQRASSACQRLLKNMSNSDILQLPPMCDPVKLSVMRLLALVTSFAYYVRANLMPVLISRMIDLTLKHGMNEVSCVNFALISLMKVMQGNYDEADRFGNLALMVFDKYQAHAFIARFSMWVYAGAYPMKHPLRDSIEPLLAGHRSGLVVGDIHDSMNCGMLYVGIMLRCGTPLPHLASEIQPFRDMCDKYGVKTMQPFLNGMMQLAQNFMGGSNNPLILTGDFLDEDETLKYVMEKNPVAYCVILHFKHFLAVYFRDWSGSQNLTQKLQQTNLSKLFPFALIHFKCLSGLVAARLSRSNMKQKRRALKILSELRCFAAHHPQNYQNKVCLVEAELASSVGNYEEAVINYDQAIELAREHSMVHEEGLACEAAGYSMRESGRLEESRVYFRRARSCYEAWGAKAKVDQLDALHATQDEEIDG